MARHNLLENPTLELSAAGYTLGFTRNGVTATAPTMGGTSPNRWGQSTITGDGTTSTGDVVVRVGAVPVEPGVAYTFSAEMWRGTTPLQYMLGVDWLDSAGNQLATGGATLGQWVTAAQNTWDRLLIRVTPPAAAARARPTLWVRSPSTTAHIAYWDRLSLERADTWTGQYFDGDSLSSSWLGAAHASASASPTSETRPEIRSVHRATGSGERAAITTTPQTAVGDVLVAIHAADWDAAASFTAPTGTAGAWRLTATADRGQNATMVKVWDRRVTVPGAQQVSVGFGNDADIALVVLVLDGATVTTSALDRLATAVGPAATSHPASTVTTTAQNGLLATIHATSDSGTSGKPVANYTPPPGMMSALRAGSNPIAADTTASGEWLSLGVFVADLTSQGATGARAATTVSRPWATVTLAFRGAMLNDPIEAAGPRVDVRAALPAAGTVENAGRVVDGPHVRVRVAADAWGEVDKEVTEHPLALPVTLRASMLTRDVAGPPAQVSVRLQEPVISNLTANPVRPRVVLARAGVVEFAAVTALTDRRPRITTTPRRRMRFLAQRVLDRGWVSKDVGITKPVITWKLNAATEVTGKIKATELRDLGVEQHDLLLHCEIDGNVRASTILDLESFAWGGPQIELTTRGPMAYLDKLTYEGDFPLRGATGAVGVALDPLDVVRHVWAHAQSWPDGRLGVVLSSTRSTVRIGEPEKPATATATPPAAASSAATPAATGAAPSDSGETEQTSGPYILKWWEDSNLAKVVSDLATSTPFDMRERPYWSSTARQDVTLFVELGWPRVGRIRDDLSFTEHQNLSRALAPVEHDDIFATDVYVLGKGEGSARIRGRHGKRVPGRLRRTAKVEKKDCTTTPMAEAFARAEWPRRQGYISVDEVHLESSHPNAPLGSFLVGDDVPTRFLIQGVGRVSLRHRVEQLAYDPDASTLVASTRRSDTYSYGSSAGAP